ncbi:MAG: hypothetical protein IT429_16360 [Gemmataceae bacterium]|nr:hypothetical protein [Gemmataceae bacterium]
MAAPRLCRLIPILLVCSLPSPALASPFCCGGERGPTLVGDLNQASVVILGTFRNARRGEGGGGTTDLVVETVFKGGDIVAGRKVIEKLPKYLPATKGKFLVFCDFYRGTLDPYRGVEVPAGGELVKYFTGAVTRKDRPLAERLHYAFDHLNSADPEVAIDAFREYARSSYTDYRAMARKLPADTLAGWLRDPKTPSLRYGLYGLLLGQCGTDRHARLLRAMLEDPVKRPAGGVDGMLAGYVILQPKEGWAYLRGLLQDGKQEFLNRYAALRTIRFLWDERPDVIPVAARVEAVALALDYPDMADFAVEDLRKWQRWEKADRVLDLFAKESHNVPVIRRAVLRFALQCPGKCAAALVGEQRRRDPGLIKDLEELLRLETEPSSGSPPGTK